MRWNEIFEAASNIPAKYEALIDPESDLVMNGPNQWTHSPYLGAVKTPTGAGYYAQIHIPRDAYDKLLNHERRLVGSGVPESFFSRDSNNRASIRVAFGDPRQAAWLMQEVLYGDNDPAEVILDYMEFKYLNQNGELWDSLVSSVPSFEGEAYKSEDEAEYFADPQALADRRNAAKNKMTVNKNTAEYERTMPAKIQRELMQMFVANPQLARKRLGKKIKSRNELERVLADIISAKGIEHFVVAPGSPKLKDMASIPLI